MRIGQMRIGRANARVSDGIGNIYFLDVNSIETEANVLSPNAMVIRGTVLSHDSERIVGGLTRIPEVKKIVHNYPATIVLWEDGTKTIVKHNPAEANYDPLTGVALCYMKKALGNDREKFHKALKGV